MNISDLLDLDQVRAVLTVSEADLPDDTLEQFGLEDELEDILDKRLPEWSGITIPKFERKLRIFTKYQAAAILALTAPIFVLKKMTDGANEGQRSDKDGLRWLVDELQGKADTVMDDLLEELGIEVGTTNVQLVGISTPSRDPITEPRT